MNEVVAGLVEYHLIETALGLPEAADHRLRIRAMLDRLLIVGRDADGMWRSTIDIKTGASLKDTLSDNWGYVYAAYLTQAMIEENWPGGDITVAERYRAAAREGLVGASRLICYPWQGSEQDGYADTIESALYLLNRVDVPEAARWTDRQAGTLFGAQDDDGRVEDRYLDGNFVRTALLYAAWQSQGTRLEPWSASTTVGAVRDGACLALVISTGPNWQGRLVFDEPRHATTLRLPVNYPRLNEWPEWFVAETGARYRFEDMVTGEVSMIDGAEMHDGPAAQLGGRRTATAQCLPDAGIVGSLNRGPASSHREASEAQCRIVARCVSALTLKGGGILIDSMTRLRVPMLSGRRLVVGVEVVAMTAILVLALALRVITSWTCPVSATKLARCSSGSGWRARSVSAGRRTRTLVDSSRTSSPAHFR